MIFKTSNLYSISSLNTLMIRNRNYIPNHHSKYSSTYTVYTKANTRIRTVSLLRCLIFKIYAKKTNICVMLLFLLIASIRFLWTSIFRFQFFLHNFHFSLAWSTCNGSSLDKSWMTLKVVGTRTASQLLVQKQAVLAEYSTLSGRHGPWINS